MSGAEHPATSDQGEFLAGVSPSSAGEKTTPPGGQAFTGFGHFGLYSLFVIEQEPIRTSDAAERGVVAEGAVGSRWAGRLRLFRYEVRRWRDGVIPDVAEAVESPQHLSNDPERARRLLALAPYVPTPLWGRDELRAGEMWNSNSIIAWLVARAGLDAEAIQPPSGGRAPGWNAGLVVARRHQTAAGKHKSQRALRPTTLSGGD